MEADIEEALLYSQDILNYVPVRFRLLISIDVVPTHPSKPSLERLLHLPQPLVAHERGQTDYPVLIELSEELIRREAQRTGVAGTESSRSDTCGVLMSSGNGNRCHRVLRVRSMTLCSGLALARASTASAPELPTTRTSAWARSAATPSHRSAEICGISSSM